MSERLVTVFGGTGFIGTAAVRCLAGAGWRVRVAARRPGSVAELDVESGVADIRDDVGVARALEGASAVVNAVSLYAERGELTFQEIHVDGAAGLARQAREAGVERLVHVSGIGVDEHSRSQYLSARARGETAVREVFPDATILRPSVLFGPGDAFLSAVDRITCSPVVPLFGEGDTRLQPVYVEDVAFAVSRALERDVTSGRVYELGGPQVFKYREIVEKVMAHRGRHRMLVPMPFSAWRLLADAASLLPGPPLTRDQVALLEEDNVVGEGMPSLADLDVPPRALDPLLDTCLPRSN